MKFKRIQILSFLLIPIYLLSLIWSNDLKQTNSETVFLTKEGNRRYQDFLLEHEVGDIAIAKINQIELLGSPLFVKEIEKLNNICTQQFDDECHITTPKSLEKNSLINLVKEHSFALLIAGQSKEGIRKIIESLQNDPFWNSKPSTRIQFTGIPFTNLKLDSHSQSIKTILFPLFFVLTFIALLFLTKSIFTAIILFLPAIGSAGISLVTIKLIFGYSNLVLAIVPLLVFILNFVLGLHVYYAGFEKESLVRAINEKRKPIILMSLTTFIGFVSLYTSDLGVIQSFGVTSAVLIIMTFAFSLLWLASFENFVRYKKQQEAPLAKKIIRVCNPLKYHSILIIAIIGVILGASAFNQIKVLTDANQYFSKDAPLIQDMKDIANSFIGTPIIEIELQKELTYKEIQNLMVIESKIKESLPSNQILLSPNSIVREVNLKYSKNNVLPDNQFAYQTLLGRAPPLLAKSYANISKYRMTIFAPTMNVDHFEDQLQKVHEILTSHNIEFEFNGIYYHLMTAQKSMIFTLLKSFLLSLLMIAIVAFIVYRKPRVFFVIILVNTVPVCLTFFFYYLFGLSFNIATVMTFSISLGIIVDSTFHQIHALEDIKYSKNQYQSKVIWPILLGGTILTLAFATFGFNTFLPIRQFGLSLAIIISIGTFFDLKILPRFFQHCQNIIEE